MKKGFIIATLVLGFLVIVMITVPFLFKNKITQKIKAEANNSINAKIDFSGVELSLFQSFPQLNIALKNLSVTGINTFEQTRLLSVDLLSTTVNLSSLWSLKKALQKKYQREQYQKRMRKRKIYPCWKCKRQDKSKEIVNF